MRNQGSEAALSANADANRRRGWRVMISGGVHAHGTAPMSLFASPLRRWNTPLVIIYTVELSECAVNSKVTFYPSRYPG